jgi:hypothetical protein
LCGKVKNLFVAIRYKHEAAQEEAARQKENAGWAVGIGMGLAALGLGLVFALRPRK